MVLYCCAGTTAGVAAAGEAKAVERKVTLLQCYAKSRQGFAAEVRPSALPCAAEESEREKDINKRAIGRVVYSARLENEYFN